MNFANVANYPDGPPRVPLRCQLDETSKMPLASLLRAGLQTASCSHWWIPSGFYDRTIFAIDFNRVPPNQIFVRGHPYDPLTAALSARRGQRPLGVTSVSLA